MCIIHIIYRPTRIRIIHTSVTPTITLLDAPLHGRINPTESTWALIPATSSTSTTAAATTVAGTGNGHMPENENRVSDTSLQTSNVQDNNSNSNNKGYILFSLYKSYEYRDIWGTAFDRQYLQTLISEKGQNYDHDLDDDDEEVINKFQ